jgi:tungstate transport system permease protein
VLRIDRSASPAGSTARRAALRGVPRRSDTQTRIGEFGQDRYGAPLFNPLRPSRPRRARQRSDGAAARPSCSRSRCDAGVCGAALAIALLVGLPLGIALGRAASRAARAGAIVNSGMGAPPVVVGLLAAILLWRSGPLGALGWMYTSKAMIAAQVVIALPLVIGITLAAVGSLAEDWELQVRSLGVPARWRLWLLVREIRMGLLAAVIAALGGILSEVGAVMMVGGNLAGETRVLTTAILMYTQMGAFEAAIGLAAVLLGLMIVLAGLLTAVQQSGRA